MGGTLEVLLVSAEGIGHANIIGKPTYHVVLECGNEVQKSKASKGLLSGDEEISWNEEFTFELPRSEMDNEIYLKLRIMNEKIFSRGRSMGETTIYLKGILIEGQDKGFMEVKPAPYNVVLDDDTYKGQIRIGLKYFINNRKQAAEEGGAPEEKVEEQNGDSTICSWSILSFWHIQWWKFLFRCKSKSPLESNHEKQV